MNKNINLIWKLKQTIENTKSNNGRFIRHKCSNIQTEKQEERQCRGEHKYKYSF